MQVKKLRLELDKEQQTGSKLGKEYVKAVYCHSVYLTYNAEYIMKNARLDEAQAGIKIAGRKINKLKYADDTICEEELKSLLIKVKEESEKAGLKCSIQKPKITASSPIQLSSVSQSHPTLRPHEPQHTRPPCPSPTPGVNANSRPSSR